MNQFKNIYLLVAFLLFGPVLHAQDQDQKLKDIIPSRFHFKMQVGIPTIVGNRALRQSFRGTYEGIANLQVRLFDNVHLGAHGSYTGFKVSGDKIAQVNTECRTAGGGFNVGYEKFSSPRVFWFVNIAAGYNFINYFRVQCPDSISPTLNYKALSYRPSVGFCYYSDANFSLGLSLSYNFLMNEFDPYAICLNNFKAYQKSDSKGYTNYFSVGVVLNFNLNKELFTAPDESDGEEDN